MSAHHPHHWINQNGRCDNGQMMDAGDAWRPVFLDPETDAQRLLAVLRIVGAADDQDDLMAAVRKALEPAKTEQPTPGGFCEECGHFAARHATTGCEFPRPVGNECTCAGMLWQGTRWPRPFLPAPEGLTA